MLTLFHLISRKDYDKIAFNDVSHTLKRLLFDWNNEFVFIGKMRNIKCDNNYTVAGQLNTFDRKNLGNVVQYSINCNEVKSRIGQPELGA